MKIDFKNVVLSKDYIDDANISYWVSGTIKINNFLYTIQGSVDSWDSIDFLNKKFSNFQVSDQDYQNKNNGMEDTFETNYKSWIINIEVNSETVLKNLPNNMRTYKTLYFDPYYGTKIDQYIESIESRKLSIQDIYNSALKAAFITWFTNYEDQKKENNLIEINLENS